MAEQTKERVSPEASRQSLADWLIFLLHERTYRFAAPQVQDQRVLEFGCGDGYGTHLLSAHAREIVGIDISAPTIAEARDRYRADNLSFQCIGRIEESPLPFDDASFDAVVSFQVIEHIREVRTYLSEIRRVLKPGGTLIVSTPNAATRLLAFQNPWNRFHVVEYRAAAFEALLRRDFEAVSVSGLMYREPWLSQENRRTARNARVLWPVTHKLMPDRGRQFFLYALGSLAKARARMRPASATDATAWPDLEVALVSDHAIESAPSLIAVCTRSA